MAKSKPTPKMKSKKPLAKKAAKPVKKAPAKAGAKGKSAMKAKPKAKPVAKKAPAKAAAKKPAPKGFLKKISAALSAKDKERAKKEAARAKLEAAKEKDRAKKEAAREKLEAAKEKDRAKKEAAREKQEAAKEKERAKKDAEKAKIQAAKDAEKNKKLAAKEAEKAAKVKAKEDEKAAAKKAKQDAKRKERGEDVDGEDSGPVRARGGDEDDDEEDFKRVAKGKGKSKYSDDEGLKKFRDAEDLEAKNADEIAELREQFAWQDVVGAIGTLDFFIDPKNDECIEKGCDNIRSTQSWCRLHYLKNWRAIQRKKEVLSEGKLQEYIEELVAKYPAKYVEAILKDLGDDKDFYKVLNELNITNDFDFEEEDFESSDDDDRDDDIGIEATFTGSMRYEEET